MLTNTMTAAKTKVIIILPNEKLTLYYKKLY